MLRDERDAATRRAGELEQEIRSRKLKRNNEIDNLQ